MSSLENFNCRYTQASGLTPAGRAALTPCPTVRRLESRQSLRSGRVTGRQGRESQPCDRSGARVGGSTAAPLLVLTRGETFFLAIILAEIRAFCFHKTVKATGLEMSFMYEVMHGLRLNT